MRHSDVALLEPVFVVRQRGVWVIKIRHGTAREVWHCLAAILVKWDDRLELFLGLLHESFFFRLAFSPRHGTTETLLDKLRFSHIGELVDGHFERCRPALFVDKGIVGLDADKVFAEGLIAVLHVFDRGIRLSVLGNELKVGRFNLLFREFNSQGSGCHREC